MHVIWGKTLTHEDKVQVSEHASPTWFISASVFPRTPNSGSSSSLPSLIPFHLASLCYDLTQREIDNADSMVDIRVLLSGTH